ncbi:hypothetical protein [Bosea sp. (in: a-proteobacteria)]|uniref:hypothetical protein n=1 Tax=Bosea sp. (in: a-proteobacteria) TaxID=1871050 RepID=UPI000A6A3351|nr:hypothetical protein [Bosea sp. (in: a-proteobacteria)]
MTAASYPGLSEAGDHGVASAEPGGFARAGRHGRATTLGDGVAIAGEDGIATAADSAGLAIAGPRGTAIAGSEGIAIAHGAGAVASAGAWGVAVATGHAGDLGVGHGGIAVALRSVRRLRTEACAIAVVLDAVDGATELEAGEGSVIVLRHRTKSGRQPGFDFHVSGPAACRPGYRSLWRDGALQCLSESPPTPMSPAEPEPERWRLDERLADIRRGHDMLVLCSEAVVEPNDREVLESGDLALRAARWSADPGSPLGIFGLSWGEGDADAVGLDHAAIWLLVRVEAPVDVAAIESRAVRGVVKFAAGTILFYGAREVVIGQLSALGGDCALLASQSFRVAGNGGIAIAPDDGAALAGHAGWAIAPGGQNACADAAGIAIASGGTAHAGRGGLALAFNAGIARADDDGVAVSDGKRYGEAHAGDRGVAIGRGKFRRVTAGVAGAAIASEGDVAMAGDEGVAIGLNSEHVQAGTDGVAVAIGGTLSGGPGCLLVSIAPDRSWAVTARVGVDGIAPFVRYRLRG